MNIDLSHITKKHLKPNLYVFAADFLKEDVKKLKKASDLIISFLLIGVITKFKSSEPDDYYIELIKETEFQKIENFDSIFKGEDSIVFEKSYNFIKGIFGEKTRKLVDHIHKKTDLHIDSIFTFMKMVVSVMIKTTSKIIATNGLNKTQSTNLVLSQEKYINETILKENLYTYDEEHYKYATIQPQNFFEKEDETIKTPLKNRIVLLVLVVIILIYLIIIL